MQQIPVGDELV